MNFSAECASRTTDEPPTIVITDIESNPMSEEATLHRAKATDIVIYVERDVAGGGRDGGSENGEETCDDGESDHCKNLGIGRYRDLRALVTKDCELDG